MTTAMMKHGAAGAMMAQVQGLEAGLAFFEKMAASSLLPAGIRNAADALVVAAAGAQFGWDPLASLQRFHVVKGKVVMDASVMMGVCLAHPACKTFHRVDAECDATRATYEAQRVNGPPVRETFTMDDARAAGLTSNPTWKKYPARMLEARAKASLARNVFPDALAGFYTPDEIQTGEVYEADIIDAVQVDAVPSPIVDAHTRAVTAAIDRGDVDAADFGAEAERPHHDAVLAWSEWWPDLDGPEVIVSYLVATGRIDALGHPSDVLDGLPIPAVQAIGAAIWRRLERLGGRDPADAIVEECERASRRWLTIANRVGWGIIANRTPEATLGVWLALAGVLEDVDKAQAAKGGES